MISSLARTKLPLSISNSNICRNISKCVHIKGIPVHTAEFQIKNALQEYGNIEYIKVFNTTGHKNGSCLVGFSDVDSAISVVDELDQRVMIYNYRVTVTYSTRRYYGHYKAQLFQKKGNDSYSSGNSSGGDVYRKRTEGNYERHNGSGRNSSSDYDRNREYH